MKHRFGFVANSSSTDYIIERRVLYDENDENTLTREDLENAFDAIERSSFWPGPPELERELTYVTRSPADGHIEFKDDFPEPEVVSTPEIKIFPLLSSVLEKKK